MPLHILDGVNFFWGHVFPKGFKEMLMSRITAGHSSSAWNYI